MFSAVRLRHLREERGITREELAVTIGRSYPSVHQYENGGITPSTEVVERLAGALAVPIDALFERGEAA